MNASTFSCQRTNGTPWNILELCPRELRSWFLARLFSLYLKLGVATKMGSIQEAMGDDLRGVACWNPLTIQYDIYTKGVSTNGLNGLLQPTRVCSFHSPGNAFDMTLNLSELVANGETFVDPSAPEFLVAATVSNSNGFSDEGKVVLVGDASDELQLSDDGMNVSSTGNIDLYWFSVDDKTGLLVGPSPSGIGRDCHGGVRFGSQSQ